MAPVSEHCLPVPAPAFSLDPASDEGCQMQAAKHFLSILARVSRSLLTRLCNPRCEVCQIVIWLKTEGSRVDTCFPKATCISQPGWFRKKILHFRYIRHSLGVAEANSCRRIISNDSELVASREKLPSVPSWILSAIWRVNP